MMPQSPGKERDAESGNDYFGARYYASTMGRFLSPDPSGLAFASLANPQSLNLYAYAANNPLRFTDPTGLYCAWEDGTSDDDPSDGGATEQQCNDQGGHWTDQSNPCGGADNCVATFDWNQRPQTQDVAFDYTIGGSAGSSGGVPVNATNISLAGLQFTATCESFRGKAYNNFRRSMNSTMLLLLLMIFAMHPHICVAQLNGTDSAEAACPGDTVDQLGPEVAKESRAFVASLKVATDANDRKAVSSMIRYPLAVHIGNRTFRAHTPEEFLHEYDRIMNGAVRKAINDPQSSKCLFCRRQHSKTATSAVRRPFCLPLTSIRISHTRQSARYFMESMSS